MTVCSITSLINLDEEYQNQAGNVSDCFQCAWDDAVHDSYGLFVKQIKSTVQEIHSVRVDTERIITDVDRINVSSLIEKTDALCKEAENL